MMFPQEWPRPWRHFAGVVAIAMLTASPSSSAVTSLTPLERQRLLAHLEMTRDWFVDEVRDLSAAQMAFRPAPDAWSVAEVVDHLLVVAPIYWGDLQAALKGPPRGGRSATTDADILWYGIDRTDREQAIAPERPRGAVRDLATAVAEYRTYHNRLLQYVRTTPDDLRAHHVSRQGSDAYQWVLLISSHEQRHILQIRAIKAHPRFPRT